MFNIVIEGETLSELIDQMRLHLSLLTAESSIDSGTAVKTKPLGKKGRKIGSGRKPGSGRKKKVVEEESDVAATPANDFIMQEFDEKQKLAEEAGGNGDASFNDNNMDDLLDESKVASAKTATIEDVKNAARGLMNNLKAKNRDGVAGLKKVLNVYQAAKIGELKESHYSNFIQRCQSIG